MTRGTSMNRREVLGVMFGSTAALAASALGGAWETKLLAAPSLLMRRIPSSGEEIPAIGLGTWQSFDVGRTATARAGLEQVLHTFVEMGGTLIDSSPMYGSSEEVAGDLAEKLGLQSRLFVATKVWTSGK